MTQNNTMKNMVRNYLLVVSIIFVSFFVAKPVYATSIDLNQSLSEDEKDEIADYADLSEMVGEIFDISDDRGTADLSDPIKLMFSLVGWILKYWDEDFIHSSLYHLLVGLAMIFLVANFIK